MISAVKCTFTLLNEKLEEDTRSIIFYIKEAKVTDLKKFLETNKDALQFPIEKVELEKTFETDKEAHEYMLENVDGESLHSWPILILNGTDSTTKT